jgi:hypothetical protein
MGKTLHIKGTGQLILRLTDAQLSDLTRALEEESLVDRDYYIDDTTIGVLEEKGADAQLVKALRRALENKRTAYRDPATPEPTKADDDDEGDGIDVEWRESEEGA